MAVHKLHIGEYDEIDYQLIAIHSPLEDFRLAYYINQNLPINLKKSTCDIHVSNKEGEAQFTRFVFEDDKEILWSLFQNQNKALVSLPSNNQGLFKDGTDEFSTNIYLIPEFKKVDYFLKIENDEVAIDISQMIRQIKKIERITTVYSVEVEKIKSKNNLIF